MTDRTPTKVLTNGAVRYGVYDEAGTFLRYEYIRKEDNPGQIGTVLNKATLLKDETASKLGLTQADPTVDDALNALSGKIVLGTSDLTPGSNSPYPNGTVYFVYK